jgi:hypothetical protein
LRMLTTNLGPKCDSTSCNTTACSTGRIASSVPGARGAGCLWHSTTRNKRRQVER